MFEVFLFLNSYLALPHIFPYLIVSMTKKNLKGFNLSELQAFVEGLGAEQLYSWLYAKAAQNFDEMTDISKDFRVALNDSAAISNLQPVAQSVSTDGTTKFLFSLEDGLAIESVLIPSAKKISGEDKRLTLCVSTQVGCPLDCKFCATGAMGFLRNLTAGEIIDQVIQGRTIPQLRERDEIHRHHQ